MAFLEKKYRISTGEYGLAVIEVTGRCTHDEAATVEAGCTRRYRIEAIPHASGGVFKAMDGTNPRTSTVTVPATNRSYQCVKVDGRVQGFAQAQVGGPYTGKKICQFRELYQEVGSVA